MDNIPEIKYEERKYKFIFSCSRGFCAGVDRAVKIVEEAIKKYGPPIYVRHEIVHNKEVVNSLSNLGAIFVEEVTEAPENSTIIFSAHGVPKQVYSDAKKRNMIIYRCNLSISK